MYKRLKPYALIVLVVFLCSCITCRAEPDSTAPEIADPAPAPVQPDEEQLQAASDFSKEIDAIVMKGVNGFYKDSGRGVLGVYIKELGTGYEYSYNADKTNPDNPEEGYFNAASTCKLLSAAVMYHMNSCGELELDKTYTDNATGYNYNLKKLLTRMLSHSVNDYFNITLRQLGPEKINGALKLLGLKHSLVYSEIMPAQGTSVKSNRKKYGISRSPRTTPRDLGYVLELLYGGNTFGAENDKLFTEALISNIYSNRLPAGIGYRSPVAHKTGTSAGEGVYNDAGIIFLEGNPYIMVVMSKGSGSKVQALFRSIAGQVYDCIKKRTEHQSPTPK